jgi:hypothetical protein
MPIGIVNKPKIQNFLSEKRQVLEQARSTKMRRIQQDLTRIANREMEYSKKLIEELIPVKISWNEDAWKKLQEYIPIKIEQVVEEEEISE